MPSNSIFVFLRVCVYYTCSLRNIRLLHTFLLHYVYSQDTPRISKSPASIACPSACEYRAQEERDSETESGPATRERSGKMWFLANPRHLAPPDSTRVWRSSLLFDVCLGGCADVGEVGRLFEGLVREVRLDPVGRPRVLAAGVESLRVVLHHRAAKRAPVGALRLIETRLRDYRGVEPEASGPLAAYENARRHVARLGAWLV